MDKSIVNFFHSSIYRILFLSRFPRFLSKCPLSKLLGGLRPPKEDNPLLH